MSADIFDKIPDNWKNRIIAFLVGAVASVGGVGFTGGFRPDPATGKDVDKVNDRVSAVEAAYKKMDAALSDDIGRVAAALSTLKNSTYSKSVINEKFKDCQESANDIEKEDKDILARLRKMEYRHDQDVREMRQLYSRLPPDDLKKAVSRNTIGVSECKMRIKYFEEEHKGFRDRLNGR